jgi:hypothetical protein
MAGRFAAMGTSRWGAAVCGGSALVMTFGPLYAVQAGDLAPAPNLQAAAAPVSTLLDGKVFVGEIGVTGKPAHVADVWSFNDGIFWSRECVKCGYPPGGYTLRREGDEVHFETEGICEDNSARIVWRGTYVDGRIEGTMHWTKERWYRTIEKTFWFRATLDEGRRPRLHDDETADRAGSVSLE